MYFYFIYILLYFYNISKKNNKCKNPQNNNNPNQINNKNFYPHQQNHIQILIFQMYHV